VIIVVEINIRVHPDVLFGYSANHIELILRVENRAKHNVWTEAEISVPEELSLSPNSELRKGRVRVGIIGPKEFLEKAVRIYANSYTVPQMYRCKTTFYVFDKDGIIESRMEKTKDIRCELKKDAVL